MTLFAECTLGICVKGGSEKLKMRLDDFGVRTGLACGRHLSLPDKNQGFGQFFPFSLTGDSHVAAFYLLKRVCVVFVEGQRSHQVFAAIVVGNLQSGRVFIDFRRCEQPFPRIDAVAHETWEFTENLLSGYGDVVVIQIHFDVYSVR